MLSQFLLITSKLSSITQDLIGSGIERELASGFVFVPTVDNFDPAQLIRVKPITEVEDQAQARLAEFDRDDDMERDDITLSVIPPCSSAERHLICSMPGSLAGIRLVVFRSGGVHPEGACCEIDW